MARLQRERAAGLTGFGVLAVVARPMDSEEIFAALNQVEDAIASGKCIRHTGWDGNSPQGFFH